VTGPLQSAADWRWQVAAEQAHRVLSAQPSRRVSVPRTAMVTGGALVLLIGLALVLGPGSVGRFVVAGAAAVIGLVVVIADAVRLARKQLVTRPLLPRERSAVQRVIRRRATAPDDRLDVVRAAALQASGGIGLASACGQVLLFTGIAFASPSLGLLFALVAALWAGNLFVLLRNVVLANRYLDADPVHLRNHDARSGTGETPSGSIESRT
jgi:Flp pilus assembly protein TadB